MISNKQPHGPCRALLVPESALLNYDDNIWSPIYFTIIFLYQWHVFAYLSTTDQFFFLPFLKELLRNVLGPHANLTQPNRWASRIWSQQAAMNRAGEKRSCCFNRKIKSSKTFKELMIKIRGYIFRPMDRLELPPIWVVIFKLVFSYPVIRWRQTLVKFFSTSVLI